MLIIIAIMIMGIVFSKPLNGEHWGGFISHIALVVILSVCLLLYPRYVTHAFRIIIMTVGAVYFYTLFILYPDTEIYFNHMYYCMIIILN